MMSADRYQRCKDAMVFHVAGDGKNIHFVIPCHMEESGCIRVYFRDIGARKLMEIARKIMEFVF